MSKKFEWVVFFEEMAHKLVTFRDRQSELIEILDSLGVNGLKDQNPKGKEIPLKEVDPFTFTSLISKHSWNRQTEILEGIRKKFSLKSATPQDYSGIPSVDARQAWLFPYKFERKMGDVGKLWTLYIEVVKKGKITEKSFSDAMNVKYAGKAKLTQAMFRAAPQEFLPIDSQTIPYLARQGYPHDFNSAKEYERICLLAKDRGESLYVFSHNAWLSNQDQTETQFQQEVLSPKKEQDYIEPKGKIPKPSLQPKAGVSAPRYQRNPAVSRAALKKARFVCEINSNHETFPSRAKGVMYVEAHHLIPISKQDDFEVSLDVMANVVALCPNCHRLLHHGKISTKRPFLQKLFKERKNRLVEKGITPPEQEKSLLKYYRDDLYADED